MAVSFTARLALTSFRVLAIGMGAAHAIGAMLRQSMSEDGIAYLDMGDAYMRGDWAMAVNAVWSPLYSWILGLAMGLANPPPRWEIPLIHAVNFGIYLLALVGFEFFWRRLTVVVREHMGGDRIGLPEWAWVSVGYGLFVWSSLALIRIWAVTPDMLVAALVYIAAGLLVDIAFGRAGRRTQVAFGLVLGLGYLAKSVMFPLAFAFLLFAILARRNRRQAVGQGVLAVAAFLLVALPLVAILSSAKGRPTFGESGRLSYLRYVNHVPYPFWTSEAPSDLGEPVHPARLVFEDPPVYAFGGAVGGTYPMTYDPSYWYEGVTPRLRLRQQVETLLSNCGAFFNLFVREQGGFLAIVLLLSLVGGRPGWPARGLDGRLALVAVALVAFALYALVYVEGRYLGPFVVLFWAGLLARSSLSRGRGSSRLAQVSGWLLVLFLLVQLAAFNAAFLTAFLGLEISPPRGPTAGEPAVAAATPEGGRVAGSPAEIAAGLRELGIAPGDRIGFVGYAFGAYFARLGRMQIVAQIRSQDAERLWNAPPSRRQAALEAFARAGAKAVVTDGVPVGGPPDGWVRVGETGHWVRVLNSPRAAGSGHELLEDLALEERLGDLAMAGRVPVDIERDVMRADRRLGILAVQEDREQVDETDLARLGPLAPEADLPGIREMPEDLIGPWIDRDGDRDLVEPREIEQPVHLLCGPPESAHAILPVGF
jgi:hypothetical protein